MQILLLDENRVSAELAVQKFVKLQHTVQVATSVAAGEILFCSKKFDLIVCSDQLPDGKGLDFWNFCRFAKVGRYRFPFFVFSMTPGEGEKDFSVYWEQLWFGATAVISDYNLDTKLWNLLKILTNSQLYQQYRMQPRLEITGEVSVSLNNGARYLKAKIKNLSTRGMLIETSEPLMIGSSVVIENELVTPILELGQWQVRWAQFSSEGKYLVGLYLQETVVDKKIKWCEKINDLILAA